MRSRIKSGEAERSASEVTNGAFVPLVLKNSDTCYGAFFKFEYDANDPSVIPPEYPSSQLTISNAQAIAAQCATNNPLPGSIRIWMKDANEKRDPRPVTEGGGFQPPLF